MKSEKKRKRTQICCDNALPRDIVSNGKVNFVSESHVLKISPPELAFLKVVQYRVHEAIV